MREGGTMYDDNTTIKEQSSRVPGRTGVEYIYTHGQCTCSILYNDMFGIYMYMYELLGIGT